MGGFAKFGCPFLLLEGGDAFDERAIVCRGAKRESENHPDDCSY